MGNIRAAKADDAEQILDIYRPYIKDTTITYEYEDIPVSTFRKRMEGIMEKYPWLVYEEDGKIVGYAYASEHRERAAFAWDCEISVYLSPEHHRKGIAGRLYEKLFEIMKEQGFVNVYALIDYPNEASQKLHEKFGFHDMCIYRDTAYKFGAWRSLLVMEKRLAGTERPRKICIDWRKLIS